VIEVRKTRNGVGLFAARAYRENETIIRITGRLVRPAELWERGGAFMDNCFRFGPETYLDPGDGPGAYLNHSCRPNAFIRKRKNQLFLVASRAIRARREILIDYSTIIGDDDVWTMRCNCGERTCRGRIQRFGSLPAALRAFYMERGMVPGYIVRTLKPRG
jgi:SET domain-containing protein